MLLLVCVLCICPGAGFEGDDELNAVDMDVYDADDILECTVVMLDAFRKSA